MKKNKINIRFIIFIAVAVLVLALVIFGIVKLVNSKNSGYKEISPEEYIKIAEDSNYTINDITDTMSSYNYIQNAIMAVAGNREYQIEYYMFKDIESGYNFFENKKTAISMMFGADVAADTSETEEYLKYSVTSNELYCTVFQIGKTVVCVDAKIAYKDEIDKVLKKLGYVVK